MNVCICIECRRLSICRYFVNDFLCQCQCNGKTHIIFMWSLSKLNILALTFLIYGRQFPFDSKICFNLPIEWKSISFVVCYSLILQRTFRKPHTYSHTDNTRRAHLIRVVRLKDANKSQNIWKVLLFPGIDVQYECELSSLSLTLAMTSMKKTMNHSFYVFAMEC